MIPQPAPLPLSGQAPAGLTQGAGAAAGDADGDSRSSPQAMFGDILGALAAGETSPPGRPAGEPQAEPEDAVSAGILALLSGLDSDAASMPGQVLDPDAAALPGKLLDPGATPLPEQVLDPDTAPVPRQVLNPDAAPRDLANTLSLLLAEGRLSTPNANGSASSTSAGSATVSLTDSRGRLPAALAGGTDGRLAGSEAVLAAATTAARSSAPALDPDTAPVPGQFLNSDAAPLPGQVSDPEATPLPGQVLDPDTAPVPRQVLNPDATPRDLASTLSLLLAEGRLSTHNATGGASSTSAGSATVSLTDSRGRLPAALAGGIDSRPASSEAILAATTTTSTSSPASALPQGVLEALHSLAPAGQQTAAPETAGGNALATALQSAAPDRPLEAAVGRLPTAANPMPPRDVHATVSQTLEQVAWMSREGVHQARLQLDPPHLGRVDVWLDLEGGDAKLHLGAQQSQVREALEAVLPRLRDALAQQGMDLTDASVSDSGQDQPSADAGHGDAAGSSTEFTEDAAANDRDDTPLHSLQQSGIVDAYA